MDVETPIGSESRVKSWINAMRLRTLPLALSATLMGAFLAFYDGMLDAWILFLTVLTTVLLQINSNLANDYGDFQHGTDNENRIGPKRAMQSGLIDEPAMKKAIVICSLLALISGGALLWVSNIPVPSKLILLILGLAAIYASVRYTAGENPYGYRAMGDVSVMFFFGILGVIGSYYLQTSIFNFLVILPALAIGCFSAAVLNVNNTRDLAADQRAGKITLAVKLGDRGARVYHVVLLVSGMVFFSLYALLQFNHWLDWLFILAYPLFVLNAYKVSTTADSVKLDPYLKQMALSTFLMVVLLGVSVLLEQRW